MSGRPKIWRGVSCHYLSQFSSLFSSLFTSSFPSHMIRGMLTVHPSSVSVEKYARSAGFWSGVLALALATSIFSALTPMAAHAADIEPAGVAPTTELGKLVLRSVAEGVEKDDEWALLKSLGCDIAQGYFIARPMPGEAVMDWRRTWSEGK